MIQIVFTDNGKVHTVTFSGDEAKEWAERFTAVLARQNNDGANITWEVDDLNCLLYEA